MTNERDGLKPGPVTADTVPLLTAGRSVLTFQDDRLVTFEGADDRGDISFTRPDGYRRTGRHHGFFSYIGERGDDGWISWSGGENPVGNALVDVRYRDYPDVNERVISEGVRYPADESWKHHGQPSDIIAFRLVSEAADTGSLQPSAFVPTEGHGTGVVGWQPIETAPKNGTEVLVAKVAKGRWMVRVGRTHEAAYGGQGWVTVPGDWHITPAHWMPLPPPPAASVSMGTSRKASEPKAPVEAVNAELLEALRGARETIIALKNARWSEAEGSDEDWVGDIDAALAKATALEGGR